MASVAVASPAGSEPHQPLPQETFAVGQPCSTVTMCDHKAVIKNANMSGEMQQDSVECATRVLEKYNIEKDIAVHIRGD
ncbi:Dynein light chain 1, cytoplasmic [Myotis brandtii]|uniref:Dynein light chain 1, cytoplasmic n=1 Tax=Myotis brandtii TaxID=109478 RepID=S7NNV9_MYOBR|nr:Dynein light chain 1, cytoplasmic [Myotis brandtii]